jgi:hypothetical protein
MNREGVTKEEKRRSDVIRRAQKQIEKENAWAKRVFNTIINREAVTIDKESKYLFVYPELDFWGYYIGTFREVSIFSKGFFRAQELIDVALSISKTIEDHIILDINNCFDTVLIKLKNSKEIIPEYIVTKISRPQGDRHNHVFIDMSTFNFEHDAEFCWEDVTDK